uniref:Uncharacterized protein n=1 Tax=Arundo donax TaxID=35708 RepID=A0A0A9EF83_ARUDO
MVYMSSWIRSDIRYFSDEHLDVVVEDVVDDDPVRSLGGVVAVEEDVLRDIVADGDEPGVAEAGDLDLAAAAAPLGGLREAVFVASLHEVVEDAVDVEVDDERAEGGLSVEAVDHGLDPSVVELRRLVALRLAVAGEVSTQRPLRRHATHRRHAHEADLPGAPGAEVPEEVVGAGDEEVHVAGDVVLHAAEGRGEVGVGHVVRPRAHHEQRAADDPLRLLLAHNVHHLPTVLVEVGQLLLQRDHAHYDWGERVESGGAGCEADAGEEVLRTVIHTQVRRKQLLHTKPLGDEIRGYEAVGVSSGGLVLEEVLAVGRMVGLDERHQAVVVARVDDGVAEHDDRRHQRPLRRVVLVPMAPRRQQRQQQQE